MGPVSERVAAIRRVVAGSAAELLVAGRTSAATIRWLERRTASRTRALIEERGMRTRVPGQRPAASVLGTLLERDGPASLGDHLARLGDGGPHRHAGAAGPPARCRGGWPGRGRRTGSLPTSCSPTASPIRGCGPSPRRLRRPRSRSCSAATPSSGPGVRLVVGRGQRTRGDADAHGADPRPAPRPGARSRGGRRGRGARRPDPRRDPGGRPDALRPVHGPRPVRPGRRLLPRARRAGGPDRRLPDRARGAPDLRPGRRPRPRRGLAPPRRAGAVRGPRARRR